MPKKGHRKDQGPIGDANDRNGMQHLINEHVLNLKVRNYAADTVSQREKYLRWFALWCAERGLTRPNEITKPILERYQRHLYLYRNEKDHSLYPSDARPCSAFDDTNLHASEHSQASTNPRHDAPSGQPKGR